MAEKYSLEVRYMADMEECLKSFNGKLYINSGVNSDSSLKTCIPDKSYLEHHTVDSTTMHDILAQSRVIKNDEEVLAMRWAS